MRTIDNSPEMQRFAAAVEPTPEIPQRWHIGQNIVGYMPEGDVYCLVGSEQDAQQAARQEAGRILDCDADCGVENDVHTDPEHGIDQSGDYYLDNSDCGYLGPLALHVWYTPCNSPEECAAEDDEPYIGHYGEFSRERFGSD